MSLKAASPGLAPPQIMPCSTPTAAYIHIPFCRRRCYYCDFPISVVGNRPPLASRAAEGFGTIAEYVEILCQEIKAAALGRSLAPQTSQLQTPQLQTVFFGGGTPSLLTGAQLEQVLIVLDQQFGIAADAEISMEIDPDTFDYNRLQAYRTAGVNRVSLGVQAFQTELLQACGRTHTREDVETAVELIHQVGLTNFSLDLISGLPHQTMQDWQNSLAAAVALAPTHLSIYDLTVEPGTAFERWYQPGVVPLPTEAATAQMYRLAQQTLTQAGFTHYEVSNYAKPGYQCRHNRTYWENRPYYGFGMAAASYLHQQRFTRPRKRRAYYDWVQEFTKTGTIDSPITPDAEVLLDTFMLGLRLAEGLNLSQLAHQFGTETIQRVVDCLQPYQEQGWVVITASSNLADGANLASVPFGCNARIRLSDPDGFLFSNVVLTELFHQLS